MSANSFYSGFYEDYIENRVYELAKYIISTGATVRQTAEMFSVSKSTVHKDVTERLQHINKDLFFQVKQVLDYNKAQRHIRGGQATMMKYKNKT